MFSQWIGLTGEEVCRRLDSNPVLGLDEEEAARRLHRGGLNVLKSSSTISPFYLFINQFKDFMVLVLLAATFLSALMGEYSDAVTILVIVLANAVMGLIQEYRAERSLEALKKLASPISRVLRGGDIKSIPARETVPGDIIFLETGDKISADMRLLEVKSFAVNEAALTGESEAVLKRSSSLSISAAAPGDAFNMAFSGTEVAAGRATGIVVATAMMTEIGRIAHLITGVERTVTPLQERLGRLGKVLVGACLFICCGVTLMGVFRGVPLYNMLMSGISLAVAAIPEGLPAIVTIALALGVQRMIRRRAIVRRLPAVETLGSASVICSDKTGTLTENSMAISRLYSSGLLYKLEGGRFYLKNREGWRLVKGREIRALRFTLSITSRCCNACLERDELKGDPTEKALLEGARRAGIKDAGKEEGREMEYPFSSERKMMSVIWHNRGKRILYLKGAPELVLERCRYIWSDGRVKEMSYLERIELQQQVELMASLGLRALAAAYRDILHLRETEDADRIERELVWAGVAGLEDPPRPEVLPAVRLCREAGIKVVMITGDHRGTAEAVARRLEILKPGGKVLTGKEMSAMDDRRLQREISQVNVFARVSPAHKLRIVRAFKLQGEVVAMTGDGINDAPAVKEADIGIAMGRTGTDVTREAAALVLADDNFSTIVAAVEEGRNIYCNIRKFIRFLLGCNTGEVLTMVLAIISGLPLPFRPIQILWINLVTDGLPALALGVDAPEKRLMEQPPRKRDEGVFSGGLWGSILCRGVIIALLTVAVFALFLFRQESLDTAQTAAFATLIVAQLAYVFDCRHEKGSSRSKKRRPNRFLYAAVASSCLLMLAVIYNPFLSKVFYTVPLQLNDWLVIAAVGLIPSLLSGASPLQWKRKTRLWSNSPVNR